MGNWEGGKLGKGKSVRAGIDESAAAAKRLFENPPPLLALKKVGHAFFVIVSLRYSATVVVLFHFFLLFYPPTNPRLASLDAQLMRETATCNFGLRWRLGWGILHRLTGEKLVKMFRCFTSEIPFQIY